MSGEPMSRVVAPARLNRAALAALAILLVALARPSAAETLVTALSGSRVEITSTYTGAEIVTFGVIERDANTIARAGGYDIVVTVRGPTRNFIVRKKEQVGFAWLNRERQRFNNVPAYLAVLSSSPIGSVTTPELRRRFRIGLDAHLTDRDPATLSERDRTFLQALKRIEGDVGRYIEDSAGTAFLTPNLFRASIYLPALAPTGLYEVETQLFAGGAQLARSRNTFEVVKTGFEQRIAAIADGYGLVYGFGVAALALIFGWIASIIFRRD